MPFWQHGNVAPVVGLPWRPTQRLQSGGVLNCPLIVSNVFEGRDVETVSIEILRIESNALSVILGAEAVG